MGKVYSLSALKTEIKFWRETGKSIVFTNGCFDLLHRGHVEYLWKAKSMGDILIIGLNSDASVRRLKGAGRPLTSEEDRLYMLSHLDMVDAVCLFSEDTPLSIISEVQPDVLVKGGDYSIHEIVGREIVERRGGKVITVPVVKGKSTSNLIDQIQKLSRNKA